MLFKYLRGIYKYYLSLFLLMFADNKILSTHNDFTLNNNDNPVTMNACMCKSGSFEFSSVFFSGAVLILIPTCLIIKNQAEKCFVVPALVSHQPMTDCQVFSHRPDRNTARIHPQHSLHQRSLTTSDMWLFYRFIYTVYRPIFVHQWDFFVLFLFSIHSRV